MQLYIEDREKLKVFTPIADQSDLSNIIEKLTHQPTIRFPMRLWFSSWTKIFKEEISTIQYSGFVSVQKVRPDMNHYYFYGGRYEQCGEGLHLFARIPSWKPKIIEGMPYILGIDEQRFCKSIITIQPFMERPLS